LVAEQAAELETMRETVAGLLRERDDMAQAAMTDALTGLYNRRYARVELARLLSQSRRAAERGGGRRAKSAPPYTVLMVDIDHFKRINDTYGHATGDRVLAAIAETMRQTCRESDTIVRWGGEEFLIICHNTTQGEALELANRLCLTIEISNIGLEWEMPWPLTASVGVSQPSSLDESYEVVIKRADDALYAAKGAGRNRVAQIYADTAA
jgi:diguanylate cyclase (GGDEF)-like protein